MVEWRYSSTILGLSILDEGELRASCFGRLLPEKKPLVSIEKEAG
jgi:hypothetical protein